VLATSRDKDIDAILQCITPACETLILTQYHNNPRGLPLSELAERAEAHAVNVSKRPVIYQAATPAMAWQLACQMTSPRDLICATGSFFLAAELLEQVTPSHP
jgi:dihydrofolate synthase/folylpolyglutamate synthase